MASGRIDTRGTIVTPTAAAVTSSALPGFLIVETSGTGAPSAKILARRSAWFGLECGPLSRPGSRQLDPPVLTVCQLACATVQLTVICLAMSPRIPTVSPMTLATVLVLGVVGTGLAYVLQHSIIREAARPQPLP